MMEALLLDAAADVVDHRVGDLDAVKTVHRGDGVAEGTDDALVVAAVRVDGHGVDPLAPDPAGPEEQVGDAVGAPAPHRIEQDATDMSTKQVAQTVWCSALALSTLCSSMPRETTSAVRAGSSTRGRPCRRTQAMGVSHPTPN
jgi:hypothetical protein